jgi:hypothetical protein
MRAFEQAARLAQVALPGSNGLNSIAWRRATSSFLIAPFV